MRKQIDCAADYDIEFFAFDWFYPEGVNKETPLNNALKHFIKAPNQERMKFCVMLTNHGGFSIKPDEWGDCYGRVRILFKQPVY